MPRARTASAPARPARAAPPASRGVLARCATDATLLAPLDAVSLTVSPTDPMVLRPLRERLCAALRVLLERLPAVLRRFRERLCVLDRDALGEERPREEEPRLDELRELAAVLRPFVLVCRDFDLVLVPFRELLERLDAGRVLLLAFACAISSSLFLVPLLQLPAPVPVGLGVTRASRGETAVRSGAGRGS